MLLIGVFALVLMLANPANADPVSIAILGVVSTALAKSAIAVAITTAVLTMAVSLALSYVASALLKPAAKSGAGAGVPDTSLNSKQSVRQPTAPLQVVYGRTKVGGVYADMWVGNGNQNLYGALILGGHEFESIDEIWLGDQLTEIDAATGAMKSGRYSGNGFIFKHLGAADQAADQYLIDHSNGRWTSNHRLRGLPYLGFVLYWDNTTGTGNPYYGTFQISYLGAKLWSGGLPNITAVVKGKKIYDPRTGQTVWSNNSALIVADYLCDKTFGLGVDYATGIDEISLIAAANSCDEMVTTAKGTQEKRFTTDGFFKVDGTPDAILGRLLAAMHGSAIYDGERWVIQAGVYYEPDPVVLTDDDMRAASNLQTLTSTRDISNGVKGTYVGEETKWQPADFPALKSATFTADDGGVDKWRDIELPFSSTATRCQRLAKIDLLKARYETVETFKGKLSCWRYRAGQTVLRTSTRYGWTNKPFMVGSVRVVPDQDAEGNPMIGVDLTLYETDPSIYDWATSEEKAVRNPTNPTIPDLYNVLPPSAFSASEQVYTTANGQGVKSKVVLTWNASDDALVKLGGYYQGEWRKVGDTAWNKLPQTTDTLQEILDVQPASYQFRLRAFNYAGNPSTYVTASLTVSGDATPPEDVAGFTSSAGVSGFTTFSWTAPVYERARAGTAEMRYSTATSGATWASATPIVSQSALNTTAIIQTKIGTYLIKFRSANGVYSVNAASVVITTTAQPKVGIEIVDTLPTTDLFEGRIVYLTSDDKLYRYTGSAWTRAVPAVDITGTIESTQITDGAISTPKLAANAVTAAKIAANTITANEIAAGAITTDKITAGAVTAAKIAVNQLSAMSADLGTVTAGTITGLTHQTASAGAVRAVFDTRVMFRCEDPVYYTKPYYRSVGWSEPNIASHIGAEGGLSYSRLLNYGASACLDTQSFGSTSSPSSTPNAIGANLRGDNIGAYGISAGNTGVMGGGAVWDFYAAGAGSNYGPFTGSHDALMLKTDAVDVGDIVVDVELIAQKSVSNALTRVERSTVANQPGALGVVSSRRELTANVPPAAIAEAPTEGRVYTVIEEAHAGLIDTHDRLQVNAVGEGLINVCGQGGDIAIGDLIVASDTPGKGMRQADDIVRGYTVAKARETATFATAGEVKTIACIYVSG